MKRIVVANYFSAWPPLAGGQRRIFFLARELSKTFSVEVVVPDREGIYKTIEYGPSFREIRVPVEKRFRDLEMQVERRLPMCPDLAYARHWKECRSYQDFLAQRLAGAAAAITSHPYSAYAILSARPGPGVPMIFDSHNFEIEQKRTLLAEYPDDLAEIRNVEETAIRKSALTVACCAGDADAYVREYAADRQSIRIVENGVDAMGVPDVPDETLTDIRAELGLRGATIAVFAASYHFPNFRAADIVLDLALRNPDIVFLILGTVCDYKRLKGRRPANVLCLGAISETTKWLALSTADIGLNPMEAGSGTNIKMFEYAAAGLAVLSTGFGARGVPLEPGTDFVMADTDRMNEALHDLCDAGPAARRRMGARARAAITGAADWSVIGHRYRSYVSDLVGA